jgi:hypothetical protein
MKDRVHKEDTMKNFVDGPKNKLNKLNIMARMKRKKGYWIQIIE